MPGFRALSVCFGLPLLAVCSLEAFHPAQGIPAASQPSPSPAPQTAAISPERTVLNKYCVTCHNDRLKTAGLALDKLDVAQVGPDAAVWEKLVQKLRSGSMPPAGLPRPDKATYDSLAASLETSLDRAAAAHPNPGRAPAHRLNRAEYTNAVRELLGVDVDGRSLLPPDESGYGFDNIADVLSVSPALLDRYMIAAEKISRLAIGDPSMRPEVQRYTVPYQLWQDDRMSEELPFGSRGGIAVRHHFPLDGEYQIKVILQRAYQNPIRGLHQRDDLELRLDRKRIKLFTVGGEGPISRWAAVVRPSLYEQTADQGLEVRVQVKAGTRLIGAAFLEKSAVDEGVLDARPGVGSLAFARDRRAPMAVDSVQITGPYDARATENTPSRQRIFVCYPAASQEEKACARKIVSTLARRAYRRPVTDVDVQPLLKLYDAGRARQGFDEGIEFAVRGILIDPEFLFRIERDPVNAAPGPYRVSDTELATRLSFFLWSTIPDEELLTLAERGKLRNPATLKQQVSRMLRDARSDALIQNFFGQWLLLRNVRTRAPDPDAYPDFDENLREALERETELFVESQVREDRSVVDLLRANYTFLNERLARHYGIPNIYGNHFRRVTSPDDTRVGLLGQGSILTVTSYPNRTSPTQRGLWVLDHLLGARPPAPPPDVPSLPEPKPEHAKSLTMRERMDQHRTNAVCASCHASMDPLGFALENFDGIGAWRVSEGNASIDPSGALPDGSKFAGPAGLRGILLGRQGQFVQTVTEKLLTYALGRGVEYYDAPAVRKIAREAAAEDYRWSSVILGIVNSTPFQMRRLQEP